MGRCRALVLTCAHPWVLILVVQIYIYMKEKLIIDYESFKTPQSVNVTFEFKRHLDFSV